MRTWLAPNAPRILVVDDDGMVLRGIRKVLQAANFAVEVASEYAPALEKALTGRHALIIVDVVLCPWGPGGYDLIHEFRDAGHRSTPVVVISGNEHNLEDPRAEKLRVTTLLAKPFLAGALVAAVEAALGAAPVPMIPGAVLAVEEA